jgi:hypothetical protein
MIPAANLQLLSLIKRLCSRKKKKSNGFVPFGPFFFFLFADPTPKLQQ